eukprot:8179469-Ditylum_brightwellii.AAC.1
MKIPGTNVKDIVPKHYLQIPVHELHEDLIKDPVDGGLLEARDSSKKILICYNLHLISGGKNI